MLGVLQEAVVESIKNDFVSDRDLNDPEVQPWEKKALGLSPVHRLSRVGKDAVNQRIERLQREGREEDPQLQEARDRTAVYFAASGRAMMGKCCAVLCRAVPCCAVHNSETATRR